MSALARAALAGAALAVTFAMAAAPAAAGVGTRSYVFVDKSRATPPNGSSPGSSTRTLRTLLFYPAQGSGAQPVRNAAPLGRRGGYPLIVFSHGLGATASAFQPAFERWVRRGYVVAAPDFPLSNGRAPGGPSLDDSQEQPADVRFVIDRVLRLARRNQGGLRETISQERIGAAGHSLGAVTTLAVTANSCCRDPRIDAAVAWAGLQLPFDGGTYFSVPSPPLLLAHGTADNTYPESGRIYKRAPRPKAFVTLIDAPHILNGPPWLTPTLNSTIDWFDGFLKTDRTAFRRLRRDANVPDAASLRTAGVP